MNKKKSEEILSILEELIPDPKCELEFKNNFELIISVLLSAQTTDKRVNIVTKELFSKYPTPQSLSEADYEDVCNIIRSLGLVTNKAKNIIKLADIIHNEYNDQIPEDIEKLTSLPGVGHKTASVVLALGFNIPAMPVDTHLYRMAKRLQYIKYNQSIIDAEEAYKRYIPKEKWIKSHHLLLLFGRYFCKSKNPECGTCRLQGHCLKKVDK